MENILPQVRMSYSKAITLLCNTANRFDQVLKRQSIFQMIQQEHQRRNNIQAMRQLRMEDLLRHKSNHREVLSKIQNQSQHQLDSLRWKNNRLREHCQKSVQNSRRDDYNKKRKSAENVRELIQKNHRKRLKDKQNTLKRSFANIRQLYRKNKQSIRIRLEKNTKHLSQVSQRNNKEVMEMLRKTQMFNKLITKHSRYQSEDNLYEQEAA